ncbi:hypothetical protein [Antrihabitans sp. YC2-6]|uniref:hypothetical protein n=1 Tax=Antrihabitans sp. YC2-6 TaxID=2799498 RepID=UPI0018F510E7|nr:hypothetical protein [Antrihabitans sp. YC2-6]MBJ8345729.1 hypothetical protein [Antrihabitans sp. YC2-6]
MSKHVNFAPELHENSPPLHALPNPPAPRHRWSTTRIGLYLMLAGMPLLAISVQVFGLVSLNTSAAFVIIPFAAALTVLAYFAPHPTDRIVGHGLLWGIVACIVYDIFRLDTVYLLGLWSDFIPTMGTWITNDSNTWGGAIVGYLWRYIGDGGGIGITFFIFALAIGIDRWSKRNAVLAAVGFAVFPVWTGLVATIALSPHGAEHLFPLTARTMTLSLIGHFIFGLVMGLGFVRSRNAIAQHWHLPPLFPIGRDRQRHSAASGTGIALVARRSHDH